MRRPRLKLNPEEEEAYYHCISRTAGAQWLLGEREKEVLRKQLWALAEYCGLEIVTYTLMSNHYHVLLKVPQKYEPSDRELLSRFRALYPNLKQAQERALKEVEKDMEKNGETAQRWRKRQLSQMFDVSQYNKLLKMRFSIWYNKTHERVGTLWSERFKSVLVESGEALRKVAAYIDLNSARAYIVQDPKEYRFCGYAEAVGGKDRARKGLEMLYGRNWAESSERYRCQLLGTLAEAREKKASLSPEAFAEAVKSEKKLPMPLVLMSRVRYFVDGVVLGSEAYVRAKAGKIDGKEREPQKLEAVTDWSGLCVISRMRSKLWS